MKPSRPAAILVVALAGMLLAGCATTAAKQSSPSPVLSRIRQNGELVVGTAGSMPPLNMTAKNGEIIGFEVDMARAIAEGMQVKLRFATMPFADLLPALEAGRVDMVLSGVTMTSARNMSVAFVGPYFVSGKSFLTTTATLTSAKGSADLNNPSVRLAALRASTSQTFVQQTMPKANLVLTNDYDEAINLVLQDKVDAMIADYPVCILTVARYPDRGLFALATPLTREPIGIALPGNDPLLVNWTVNWLRELQASGDLDAMRDRWFKSSDWLGRLP
ncbi:MAG TPA: transporter substrate-binding domain-containing protein [Candidatus Methylomirabilis sp.]|nr:transporter substrate-binding domain-containing protein [Candidatus Methylomirabilis sp.]